MKCGDIFRNHWAGESNPTRYFVFIRNNGEYSQVVSLNGNNELAFGRYYSRDLKNDTEHFEVVGHLPLRKIITDELHKFLDSVPPGEKGENNAT